MTNDVHNGAQPMVDEYLACWMMEDEESNLYYGIWTEIMNIQSPMSFEEEDKLYIRELELVSLGGC